jgi:hypothetical protein
VPAEERAQGDPGVGLPTFDQAQPPAVGPAHHALVVSGDPLGEAELAEQAAGDVGHERLLAGLAEGLSAQLPHAARDRPEERADVLVPPQEAVERLVHEGLHQPVPQVAQEGLEGVAVSVEDLAAVALHGLQVQVDRGDVAEHVDLGQALAGVLHRFGSLGPQVVARLGDRPVAAADDHRDGPGQVEEADGLLCVASADPGELGRRGGGAHEQGLVQLGGAGLQQRERPQGREGRQLVAARVGRREHEDPRAVAVDVMLAGERRRHLVHLVVGGHLSRQAVAQVAQLAQVDRDGGGDERPRRGRRGRRLFDPGQVVGREPADRAVEERAPVVHGAGLRLLRWRGRRLLARLRRDRSHDRDQRHAHQRPTHAHVHSCQRQDEGSRRGHSSLTDGRGRIIQP